MMKPEIHFQSCHESGNIFAILAMVRCALRKQHRITEYNDLWQAVQYSGSYEAALALIREKVDLIDDDGEV